MKISLKTTLLAMAILIVASGCSQKPDAPEPTVDYSKATWGDVFQSMTAVQDSVNKTFALTRSLRKNK